MTATNKITATAKSVVFGIIFLPIQMAAFYSAVIEITDKDDWFITKKPEFGDQFGPLSPKAYCLRYRVTRDSFRKALDQEPNAVPPSLIG